MIRKLNAIGIAIFAVFAVSEALATPASADEFHSEAAPVVLAGTSEFGTESWQVSAGNVSCHGSFSGTVSVTTTSTLSLSPSYTNCIAFGFSGSAVDMNGCTYLFHSEAGVTLGTTDLVCPAGKEVTITAISVGTTKCTIHLPAQSGFRTMRYTNSGSGATREITIDASIVGTLKYTLTEGTGLGKCAGGSSTTGFYNSKILLTGEQDLTGPHIGIWVA